MWNYTSIIYEGAFFDIIHYFVHIITENEANDELRDFCNEYKILDTFDFFDIKNIVFNIILISIFKETG
jgi:hypothetical protein